MKYNMKKSTSVYLQVVENKYQPEIPEREALQDWDLREVVSFKFIFIFFSDPFIDLFDFPINSRYQDLDLNKEIFHTFCFTAMILMLTLGCPKKSKSSNFGISLTPVVFIG